MNAPCNGAALDWQKAVAALSRASGRYAAMLARAGGNRAEATRLLWTRSRRDRALREDLAKAACALLALAMAGETKPEGPESTARWGRPGRLSKCENPEVGAFVRERLGKAPVREIVEAAQERFGPKRAPRASTIYSYWSRLRQGLCVPPED